MNTTKAKELINKFHEGTLSSEDEAILDGWYLNFSKDEQASITDEHLQDRKLAVINRLDKQYHKRSGVKLWPRIAVAAAAVAAIVFGVWFFYSSQYLVFSSQNLSGQSANDIAPGRNTATLTLADGKVINLSDAKSGVVIGKNNLAYNDGSLVQVGVPSPGAKAQLTASTPRGGTYQIILPDGSKVWLNAASSLKFPSTFARLKNREVELVGEAYFEIFKNKGQPFIVKSKDQEITVLGTHFNVNSYAYEDAVKTTLLEGSVQIIPLQEPKKKTILKPGEQAIVSKQFLKILPVDVEVATAWKNGNFLFRNEQLESILNRLAYWYDVEIVYRGKKPDMLMSGMIERKRKLSSVLNLIESTGRVKFKVEGRKVYVMN
jgi:transmembrane sensor